MDTAIIQPMSLDELIGTPSMCKRRHFCTRGVRAYAPSNSADKGWAGTTRNISMGGIGVLLERSFDSGSVLALEVDGPPGLPSWKLEGKVIHATPQDPEVWLIGLEFSKPLGEADLQTFLGPDA